MKDYLNSYQLFCFKYGYVNAKLGSSQRSGCCPRKGPQVGTSCEHRIGRDRSDCWLATCLYPLTAA